MIATEAVLVIWLLVIGGVFGSFFNVVIYRLPAGLSLVRPASHCPICKHPIRWRDNVPVLGWVLLRGRCRDCGTGISARYPIVEAVTALMFAGVGVADEFNFPLIAYHLVLLCTLECVAMIEWDGNRAPPLAWIPAIVVRLIVGAVWPGFQLPVFWVPILPPDQYAIQCAAGLAAGAVAGLGFGAVLWWAVDPPRQSGIVASAVCVGLFLGWPAVCGLVPVSALICLAIVHGGGRLWPALRRVPMSGVLWIAAIAWIVILNLK